MVDHQIIYSWQHIYFTEDTGIYNWFNKNFPADDEVLYSLIKNFQTKTGNDNVGEEGILYVIDVRPDSYSTGLEIKLDTIWSEGFDHLDIRVEVDYQPVEMDHDNQMLVLSIIAEEKQEWYSFPFNELIGNDRWNYAVIRRTIHAEEHRNALVKAYVWNNGSSPVSIKDLQLKVSR
jgi:hypothetical protein